MKIKIKKLHEDAVIPSYASPGASGLDLSALEDVSIRPGETKLVRTGLAVDVGYGYELQIRPRSGLSLNTPLRVANSPGTVDSDYRGEVLVMMTNTQKSFLPWSKGISIKKGDRIAQGVVSSIDRAHIVVVEALSDTTRGDGGFGSTGK